MDKKQENEVEKVIKERLHNIYIQGLSVGGKSFIGVIYDMIKLGREREEPPETILNNVELRCKRLLEVEEK